MDMIIQDARDFTRINLSGRMDLEGVQKNEGPFLRAAEGAKKPVLVDISGVVFLASLGIRMLFESARSLQRKNLKIVLLKPGDLVEEILETAALTQVIPVFQDEKDAVRALATG